MKNKNNLTRRNFVRNTTLLMGGILGGIVHANSRAQEKSLLVFLEGGVRKKDMEDALAKTGIAHKLQVMKISCDANLLCHSQAICKLFSDVHHVNTSLSQILKMQGFRERESAFYVKKNFEIQVISGFDCAHYNDQAYHELLESSSEKLNYLIQKGIYKNILCCSEFGRNENTGNHDGYPDGYIHHHEENARETFLLFYQKNAELPADVKQVSYTSEIKQLINLINSQSIFLPST
jgi:hypothetical protein